MSTIRETSKIEAFMQKTFGDVYKRNNMFILLGMLLIIFGIMLGMSAFSKMAEAKDAFSFLNLNKQTQEQTAAVDDMLAPRVLGNPDAPVTITEFSSLTCPHCAEFHKSILPEIKKNYIETGKVKLVFSDFPLDELALRASMTARCVAPEKSFTIVDILFRTQETWVKMETPQENFERVALLAGLSKEDFKACMDNQKLVDGIVEIRRRGQEKYNINSTPTFVFNDGAETIQGARPFEEFARVIDGLLPEEKGTATASESSDKAATDVAEPAVTEPATTEDAPKTAVE